VRWHGPLWWTNPTRATHRQHFGRPIVTDTHRNERYNLTGIAAPMTGGTAIVMARPVSTMQASRGSPMCRPGRGCLTTFRNL